MMNYELFRIFVPTNQKLIMTERLEFTIEEKEETLALYQKIREEVATTMHEGDGCRPWKPSSCSATSSG